MKILVLTFLKRSNFEVFLRPSTLKTEKFSKTNLNGGYVYTDLYYYITMRAEKSNFFKLKYFKVKGAV